VDVRCPNASCPAQIEERIKHYARRQAMDIEGMIQDFMRKYEDLDAQVKFEESRNGVSDPGHFNYSLAAKAARGRRDNLMRSISELKDQFADAQTALADEERELRKVELLAEKEGGANNGPPPQVQGTPTSLHVR
jgi:flagellar export protein FliJ